MTIPNLSLDGKVAIITGGSKGIGRAIALTFAEAGADVVVCSRAQNGELGKVADEIKRMGRRSLAVQADVSKKADVDNLVERAIKEFGAVDILVNNAGTILKTPLVEISEEEWDQIMDTNLKGCHLCSQAVSRRMIDQKKGNIINMASIRSIAAAADRAMYCVSKVGVIMLTRVLALDLARYNIRVNAIAPGWIKTRLNEVVWGNPETLKKVEATIPLGHMGEPKDIAGTALFLASDASSYITGQTIIVDGGFIA